MIIVVVLSKKNNSPFQLQCLWHNSLLYSRENPCPKTSRLWEMYSVCVLWQYSWRNHWFLHKNLFNSPFLWWSLEEFLPGCIQRRSLFVCLYKTVQWIWEHWDGPGNASPLPVQKLVEMWLVTSNALNDMPYGCKNVLRILLDKIQFSYQPINKNVLQLCQTFWDPPVVS